MKISFWIPAVYLYVHSVVFSTSVQVGTVLFTTTDLVKKCWTESDKSLLKARMIMQDVLPDPDCIDFSNPEAVSILLDYFESCYHTVAISTYGKIQNLMYLALSDALGGYLRAYVLPFTKRAYYAGLVDYSDAKRLFQFYDDIRVFLKTNGVGWAEPQRLSCRKLRVRPLTITGGDLQACKDLYVIEKKGKFHCINSNSNLQEAELPKKKNKAQRGEFTGFPAQPGKYRNPPKGYSCRLDRDGRYRRRRRQRRRRRRRRGNGGKDLEENDALSFFNFINGTKGSERFFQNLSRSRTREEMEDEDCQGSGECEEPGQTNPTNVFDFDQKDPNACDFLKTGPDVRLRRVIVPLPILDDCRSPHSIAVPFKSRPLRNLRTAVSAFVLEYYYLAVMKCFIAKGNTRSDIKNFNGKFHSWLVSQVTPHLWEEEWYPGFGGVLRVLQTIKKFGVETPGGEPVMHDIAFMFNEGAEFEVEGGGKERGNPRVRNAPSEEELDEYIMADDGGISLTEGDCNTERHALIVILIVSIIWLFVFCAFAFYCQASRGHKLKPFPGQGKTTPRRAEEDVKLQFLVKFFKKDRSSSDYFQDTGRTRTTTVGAAMVQEDKKELSRVAECKETAKEGDCLNYFTSLFSSVLPAEPCFASFDKSEKRKRETKAIPGGHDHAQGDQIHTLWRKQSPVLSRSHPKEGRDTKVRKARYASTISKTPTGSRRSTTCTACYEGSKGYSTGNPTTCYCSESCGPWATTTTTTSSTQAEEKLSSATLEFFEDVIAKHKARKESSLRTSTADSDSEFCTSSETDYSTRNENVHKNSKYYP